MTDANGCTATTSGTITEPTAVVASSSNTAILCNGGNSIVTVSATGGTGAYSGTGTFSHAAGTYSYTVTDANSCTATTTGTITQPSSGSGQLVQHGDSVQRRQLDSDSERDRRHRALLWHRHVQPCCWDLLLHGDRRQWLPATTTGTITEPSAAVASSSNTAISATAATR